MATWQQFEAEAPELAAQIRSRFEAHEAHVLATLRPDGSPRVSGSEVEFSGAELSFGSMLGAVKAKDLRRDPRLAIHAHPNKGDAKIAGRAVEVVAGADKEAMRTAEQPPGDYHAFRLDLTEAVLTTVDEEAQQLVIQLWRPGKPVKTIRRS
ncbi:MAG TPA: pyridoxamine 5'-phosphate oxidase family protein [Pseudonocardiaceae bacterium]|jgi:hypothetical protein|nr:pyridoxamine 5'-phosphate oxidase family protein [Pseudonocardiaceae bacterium]